MGARPTPERGCSTGNFVTEWFGHQVWPTVDATSIAWQNQSKRACPFLTTALGEPTGCVKIASGWKEPYGVCTISSDSNGKRQDWIACPFRTLDQHFTLLKTAIRWCYRIAESQELLLLPPTILNRRDSKAQVREALAGGRRVFVFSAQKLGGEIDLPETDASPGAAVDMSVIEVLRADAVGHPEVFGKHMFYEIQTADFHGSPLHAAKILRAACPMNASKRGYHRRLEQHIEICGTGVEGPNKANIFKRTVYQMIYKIALAQHEDCAGFAIVLPEPVWESWLRHLGQPTCQPVKGRKGVFALRAPSEDPKMPIKDVKSAALVFDIERDSPESPHPLRILRTVLCSGPALAHFAFNVAAQRAIQGNVIEKFRASFVERIQRGLAGD